MIKIINGVLIVVGMIAVGIIIGVAYDVAEAREAGYWQKLNTHVLKHGGESGHDCPYSSEWCNENYKRFLESRGKAK